MAINDFRERTDMKKILTGVGLMALGFVTWVGCAYIRPGLFGISLALAINLLILVFLGGVRARPRRNWIDTCQARSLGILNTTRPLACA